MAFFKQFPKVDYDFRNTGTFQKMTDIYRSIRVLPSFLDQISGYKFYEIINGERPDIVSQRLYGSSQYYWTFFVVNDFLHDGYRAWPMSQEALQEYIAKEYEGYVITTNPVLIHNSDGLVTGINNSIVGKFQLGETITGADSGATGTLTKKDIDMNQLIIQNVTGAFIGDPTLIQNTTEQITGAISSDTVSTYQVFKYADAPYYYYNENHGTGAIEKIVLTNGGSNYTSAPTVTITSDGTTLATATATIADGRVTSINVGAAGSGHKNVTVTITGGGGSGATARAVLFPDEKRPETNAIFIPGGVAESDLAYETYREHEFELNEERSKIRYVDPNYIEQFVNDFEELLNE